MCSRAEARSRALPGPPSGQHYTKSGLLQRDRLRCEEVVRTGSVYVIAFGCGGLEAFFDTRTDPGRLAEREQQMFPRLEIDMPPERRFVVLLPDGAGGNDQARIV